MAKSRSMQKKRAFGSCILPLLNFESFMVDLKILQIFHENIESCMKPSIIYTSRRLRTLFEEATRSKSLSNYS